MSIEQRLKELRITLPKVGSPLGNYVHANRVGNLLYLSGKGPESADGTMPRGKLGAGMSIEEGYRHARQVGLVLIAAIKDALGGDLERVERIVKVLGMLNATPDFEDHPKVVNGCSDLFVEVFGANSFFICVMNRLPLTAKVNFRGTVSRQVLRVLKDGRL